MQLDEITNQIFIIAYNEAKLQTHEFVTPEHILAAALFFDAGKKIIMESGGDIAGIQADLQSFFDYKVPKRTNIDPVETRGVAVMFESTAKKAEEEGRLLLKIEDLFCAFYELPESYVVYILSKNGVEKDIVFELTEGTYVPLPVNECSDEDDEPFNKISAYLSDMTEKAKEGKFDPLIGRYDIVKRTEQVLLRRTKNNPIHVGEPGVGKTAVVCGIAKRICDGTAPKALSGSRIFHLDLASVVAGTKYRGDFEERLKGIFQEVSKINGAIVYIDEIHNLVGAGAVSGGTLDASNILKPYLTEGIIRFIGATTYDEYKRFFEKDKALARRFQKIEIPEPTISETIKILEGLRERFGEFHNVSYSDKALELAVTLSNKYINDRFLPDKAIDVIDEAGAAIRMDINELRTDYESEDESPQPQITVCENDIEKTVSLMAKVPLNSISVSETAKLRNLVRELKKCIFGQDSVIYTVANAIKRSRSGLEDEERPIASFLFVGPTGVGKTEVARSLAHTLNIGLLRYDMSEYQEKHSVSKLIGAPPGYVGFEEGGLLTEHIRKNPHTILLLDEIEKAHQDILNILLQVMDYGRLTDSNGKKSDFKNVILIMTSNAGAKDAYRKLIGFERGSLNTGAIPKAVETFFAPEFRNRLDEIVFFNEIDISMAKKIAEKEVKKLADKLLTKNIRLSVSKNAIAHAANNGMSKEYGAREIIRFIDINIKRRLVDYILFENEDKPAVISVSVRNGELTFSYKQNG